MAKEKLPMSGSASFGKIVNQLGQATKKPAQTKAPVVLAVQIVDKTGKVVEDKKGAAVAEAQREEEKREKKKLTLLERIADSLGGKGEEKKGAGAGNKGGFLKSILPGLLPAGMIGAMGAASLLGKLGIGAVVLGGIWAAVTAIGDGIKGMKWAKEMGMEKVGKKRMEVDLSTVKGNKSDQIRKRSKSCIDLPKKKIVLKSH